MHSTEILTFKFRKITYAVLPQRHEIVLMALHLTCNSCLYNFSVLDKRLIVEMARGNEVFWFAVWFSPKKKLWQRLSFDMARFLQSHTTQLIHFTIFKVALRTQIRFLHVHFLWVINIHTQTINSDYAVHRRILPWNFTVTVFSHIPMRTIWCV